MGLETFRDPLLNVFLKSTRSAMKTKTMASDLFLKYGIARRRVRYMSACCGPCREYVPPGASPLALVARIVFPDANGTRKRKRNRTEAGLAAYLAAAPASGCLACRRCRFDTATVRAAGGCDHYVYCWMCAALVGRAPCPICLSNKNS